MQVKYWITFNEPKMIAQAGYADGYFPPNIHSADVGGYIAAHNIIKAHAKAYRIYEKEFRKIYHGNNLMNNLFKCLFYVCVPTFLNTYFN